MPRHPFPFTESQGGFSPDIRFRVFEQFLHLRCMDLSGRVHATESHGRSPPDIRIMVLEERLHRGRSCRDAKELG